jgi:hypothetical protein
VIRYIPKQLQNASSEIYDLLVNAFKVRDDSSSITIFRFLQKRKDYDIFDKRIVQNPFDFNKDVGS